MDRAAWVENVKNHAQWLRNALLVRREVSSDEDRKFVSTISALAAAVESHAEIYQKTIGLQEELDSLQEPILSL